MESSAHTRSSLALTAVAAVAALVVTACGGGGGGNDGPATISGVVADGPLSGVTVCYDSNDNSQCDSGEPTAGPTGADGAYRFEVPRADAGQHAVIANVPATAVDAATGAAVGAAFVLKAPPSGSNGDQSVFVSPLTTLVVDVAREQGVDTAAATAQVQQLLGMSASPLANYIATPDTLAAALAATLNRVIVDVTQLASAASVPAEQVQALVQASTSVNLPALAARVGAASGTPQQVAEQVSAAVLADANLSAGTVAAQAQAQAQLSAPLQAFTPGPFVSVRRFTYTDAANYFYQVFVGDSTQTHANGRYVASEVRKTLQAGAEQAFNRNRAYWTGSAWKVCDRQWQVTSNRDQTTSAPAEGVFCEASQSQTRVVGQDVSGRRMADVVAEMRAWPLADTDGLPTDWGPPPSLLGDAVFPEGSALTSRVSTNDIGNTDSYGLLDKVTVRGSDGLRRHLANFDEDIDETSLAANFRDPNVTVNGGNAAFLDQYDVPQPADATLLNRFALADRLRPDRRQQRALLQVQRGPRHRRRGRVRGGGDGKIGEPQSVGDARVVRITSGYRAELIQATNRQRFFIERDGAVLRGSTDLQRKVYNQRPNTTAWNALRERLGLAVHAEPQAPAGPGPFNILRSFTFTDLDNYSLRDVYGDSSALDAQGFYSISERREIRSGGALQPFLRNRLYWTGSEWYYCPDDGVGITRQSGTAPFASIFCRAYEDESFSRTDITLDGRRMSEVVRDFRRYGSKDGNFDYRNWGPDQNVHTQLANAFFPAGAVMQVRSSVRKATPLAIAVGAGDRVRVAPADASVPFETWPFAASLDEMIAEYPGDINGGPLNGATAFFVHGYTLPAPPAPEYTNQVQIRVAFDANGRKARFYRNYRSVATGFTTAYLTLLDTTYTVETLGDARVLRFAALPAGFEADFKFERLFAERAGAVWYGFKDSVTAAPQFSLRLNSAGRNALLTALGMTP